MAALLGQHAKADHSAVALAGEATIYKPDGKRLLVLRRGAITSAALEAAWDFMYGCRHIETSNRALYAGNIGDRVPERFKARGKDSYIVRGSIIRFRKKDGSLSQTNYALPVRSAVAGSIDRYPRMPFCRHTEIVTKRAEEWGRCLPFIQEVAEVLRQSVPDRYAAQLQVARETHPAWVLPGTPFTTVTVNNTVAGAYHYDKGDFKPGFGVMVVFRRGQYRGGDLVFPEYGVSADLQHGDVILFDSHELHGNVPFFETEGVENEDWIRISMVFYFRQKMRECLAPAAEIARARKLRGALTEV